MMNSSTGLCIRCSHNLRQFTTTSSIATRSLTTQSRPPIRVLPPALPPPPAPPAKLDPNTVTTPRQERQLLRARVFPIGSRRRRVAIQKTQNIPFEQLPYQCFQEARQVLQLDREEKMAQIEDQRARIQRLKESDPALSGGETQRERRLTSMMKHLERLKVLADINDPLVKKRFEDGHGDMSRPVYRHLAEQKWRERKRRITEQRITQMHVVPDILSSINLTADVSLYFRGRKGNSQTLSPRRNQKNHDMIVQPGEFVASKVSMQAPRLDIQVFDRGERMVTIAVVDADVPNLETDGFDYRCHFLAMNVPVSPTSPIVRLDRLTEDSQVVLPWMAPYAIKGSPYHRLSIIILQQPEGQTMDLVDVKSKTQRDDFKLRVLVQKHKLHTIGAHLFRTEWDLWMDKVMRRLGYEGAGTELRRKNIEKLPYKKRPGERFR